MITDTCDRDRVYSIVVEDFFDGVARIKIACIGSTLFLPRVTSTKGRRFIFEEDEAC